MSRAALLLTLSLSGTLVACGPPRGGPQAATLAAGVQPAPTAAPAAEGSAPARVAAGALRLNGLAPASLATRPTTSQGAARSEVPQDEASRALLETIRGDQDPARRRAAIDRWTEGARPLEPLMDAVFADKDPLVRRWAALAIERRARPEHAPALLQASRSEPDPAVRRILTQIAGRFRS